MNHRRKIQLIAGTTYSISLPKDWVRKNNLKEQDDITIIEKSDRTLVLSGHIMRERELKEITLSVEDYAHNIDQILFAVYYLGIENITLVSKKELSKEDRAKIRKALTHMVGTEIVFEDKQKIIIKVFLDKTKVDFVQTFYRMSLIIESSMNNLMENKNLEEIRINENEVDRLYNLIVKIVSLSLLDADILHSSKINNVSLATSYFLISKRMENIGDNIYNLVEYMKKNKVDFKNKKDIINIIKTELNRTTTHILGRSSKSFEKIDPNKLELLHGAMSKIYDRTVFNYLEDTVRYVIDIQEEIVNILFYNELIKKGVL